MPNKRTSDYEIRTHIRINLLLFVRKAFVSFPQQLFSIDYNKDGFVVADRFFFFFLIILSIIIRKAGCEFIDPSKQGFLNKILMFDNVRFWKVGRTKTFSYFFFFIDDVINFYARRIYIESSRKGLLNNILMFSDVFRFCRKIF